DADALGRVGGAVAAVDRHLRAPRRAPRRVRRQGALPARSILARPHPVSRVFSRRQRRRARRVAPDGMDRARGKADPAERRAVGAVMVLGPMVHGPWSIGVYWRMHMA